MDDSEICYANLTIVCSYNNKEKKTIDGVKYLGASAEYLLSRFLKEFTRVFL